MNETCRKLKDTCRRLELAILDIYDTNRVVILRHKETAEKGHKKGSYKPTFHVGEHERELFSKKNLKLCGYKSMEDFFRDCVKWYEKKLERAKRKREPAMTQALHKEVKLDHTLQMEQDDHL